MSKDVKENAEKVNEEQKRIDHNLRIYQQGCEIPADALKTIKAGRLKGMSDVNPMWRMKRMTEIFGPCGIGWKYTVDRQWTEVYGEEVKCFCNVSLYFRDPETKEWSEAIPGTGGSAIVSKEQRGPYVNDEGYKMALTDALSIAMKAIGIGANIWYGSKATGHNESKYEEYTRDQAGQAPTFTQAQLNEALNEINQCATENEFSNIWHKWSKQCPAMCMNGTPFYNQACNKVTQIRQAAQQ